MTSTTNPHHTAEPIKKEDTKDGRTIFEPRQLSIVWGSDVRYWRLPGQSDSTNKDMSVESAAAELLQVSWLEVTGSLDLQTGKKYEVGFKVSLKADAFGWSGIPVYLMAKVGKKGKYKWIKIFLADSKQEEFKITVDPIAAATDKSSSSSTDTTLYFGLYEVWSGKWKGGLLIHNAFVQECST